MTKHGSEEAFRLAAYMVETNCSIDLIIETLVEIVSLCEADAIRIVNQALICMVYDRLGAN